MLKQGDEKIIENTVYTCKFCGKTFDTINAVNKHIEKCWMNYLDNKYCFTCKHVVEVRQAPYKGNNNPYEMNICNIIGVYDVLGCDKDKCEGYCTQTHLEQEHPECWEQFDADTDKPKEEFTQEYIEFSELLAQAVDEDDAIFKEIKEQDIKVIVPDEEVLSK